MFGRWKRSAAPADGRQAFSSCDVKVVELRHFVYADDKKSRKELSLMPSEDTRTYAGSGAILHCPKTEDDRVRVESQFTNHDGDLIAVQSLRQIAGELLCRDCIFSSMTPVQVSLHRAELARAEVDRLEAYRALTHAREELRATEVTLLRDELMGPTRPELPAVSDDD